MTTEGTVYILSASYGGSRLMYIQNAINPLIGSRAGSKLSSAMIFETRKDAETFQFEEPATGWQVQPITRKEIFKAGLLGD